MKSHDRQTQYKGVAITIEVIELERSDSGGPEVHRFTSSYLIAAQGADYGTWHHFPQHAFWTSDTAAAYALAQAQRAIDATFAAHTRRRRRWSDYPVPG